MVNIRAVVLLAALSMLLAARSSPATSGPELFQIHCSGCHGVAAQGGRGPNLLEPPLGRRRSPNDLLRVIQNGIPRTEMVGIALDAAEARSILDWLATQGRAARPPAVGDARRGEQIFRGKGNCAQCHSVRGRGGAVGPELTTVGRQRGAPYLRAALVDPDADIASAAKMFRINPEPGTDFLQVQLKTKSGQNVTGVRINEDAFSIQVRDLSNRIFSFDKEDLTELVDLRDKSVMPSYRDTLSNRELEDLTAYLVSLQGFEGPSDLRH